MESTTQISLETWQCSICQETMESEATISQRCFHVFHESCIMDWIIKQNNTCPNCKLPHFSPYEVLPNKTFEKQYAKWKADPENYSFEMAFQEEHKQTAEEVGILAEQILRPRKLRGKDRQERLTDEQIQRYYEYGNRRIMELTPNATTDEQVAIAKRIEDQADQLMIGEIGVVQGKIAEDQEEIAKDQESIRQVNARQWQVLGEMHTTLDAVEGDIVQETLVASYESKVCYMESIIEQELVKMRALPKEQKDFQLIRLLSKCSQELITYRNHFSEAGKIENQSIEESKAQLKKVNAEFEAFLAEQPENIRAILCLENKDVSSEESEIIRPSSPETPELPKTGKQAKCSKVCITRLKTTFLATAILGVFGFVVTCYLQGGGGEL